ncbi:acyl-ACP--UDP-N-acetylglucosamine O-acyltransferase [Oceanospirillum sediminis]|uniref:Acyl-[acyl-carrier-protein]--UDP-N-acetylglucosamine O-acyltransferase n=1 Tax=Oceanospirillum sediminis TaxID=2760088 RepID=A0A839II88_9GAMM|nr:acyl-ACP--UDP-N-acetylglucosamine O-acyltransferase [Oceanospirillum sediminis]
MSLIHPTAIIDSSAIIADDVEIGPYSIIGPDVEIGAGSWIGPHVVISKLTTIGKNNKIYQFSSVGEDCQDKKYAGEPTRLVIGDNNVIREGCSIHRGTVQDQGVTIIGNDNLLMTCVHIAHDCIIGNHTIIASDAAIAGHVHIDDWAIVGGASAIHQFCHIGAHAMCGGSTYVSKDIPAYLMVTGNPAESHGINAEGLKRRGFSPESIAELRRAYKVIFRRGLRLETALAELEADTVSDELAVLINSLKASTRGIVR